ncbi:hypothetical protein LTR37_017025 [Vermiconidia calcicola]|uniref:Uncharacterized protein n=1 Tax=Vermiconidia calcicola TaxID=1690605 RepID=A0ACC3ML74_9PEZI|nr:hypothetical protein LTR37_017025 [Vermiconidia calcicola]
MTGKPSSSTAHTADAVSYNAHHGKRPEMLQNRPPPSNAERTETTPVAGGSRTQAGRTENASDPSASEARRHLVAAACSLTLLIVMATTEVVSNYLGWFDLRKNSTHVLQLEIVLVTALVCGLSSMWQVKRCISKMEKTTQIAAQTV